jgi:hypothetical protein
MCEVYFFPMDIATGYQCEKTVADLEDFGVYSKILLSQAEK